MFDLKTVFILSLSVVSNLLSLFCTWSTVCILNLVCISVPCLQSAFIFCTDRSSAYVISSAILNSFGDYHCALVPRLPFPVPRSTFRVTSFINIPPLPTKLCFLSTSQLKRVFRLEKNVSGAFDGQNSLTLNLS